MPGKGSIKAKASYKLIRNTEIAYQNRGVTA